jgi:phosphatidylglycerophosphatase GEP4
MQSINLEGILYFPWVRFFRKSLAVPHFSVKDISKINPAKLKECGFKGVVFDKDNTLTAPYELEIYPFIKESLAEYREVFEGRIAIMSNFAGTPDDKAFNAASEIESMLGIPVIRHGRKKPGGILEVRMHFGCSPKELVMFGDRIFTDVVFGNRYGMLTVHTALLTKEGDNKAAAKVREYEMPLVREWKQKGITAPPHKMYDEAVCLERLF